jgi:hypothetical protein
MATTNKNRYDYLKSLIEEKTNESFATAISLLPPSLQSFFPQPNNKPLESGYNEVIGTCGTPNPQAFNISIPINNNQPQNLARTIINRLRISNSSSGSCAKYVKNIIRYYWSYHKNSNVSISQIPSLGVVGGLWAGDAKTKANHEAIIAAYNYKRIIQESNLSLNDIIKITNSLKPNIGDIMVYWDSSNNILSKQKYGHIQFYIGNNQWVSDFIHSSFVYKNSQEGCWNLVYLKSPDISPLIKS